jgi:hypothetical protein
VLVLLDSRCTPLRLVHGALALAKFQDWYRCSILRFCLSELNGSNVGITDGRICDVWLWNCLRCQDICTKFHDKQFRHLSSIMVITTAIWEAVMLALLIYGIYYEAVEIAPCGKIHVPSWHTRSNNIEIFPQKFGRL